MADEQLDGPRLIDPVMIDLERLRGALIALDGVAKVLESIALEAEHGATVVTTAFKELAAVVDSFAEPDSPEPVEDSEP